MLTLIILYKQLPASRAEYKAIESICENHNGNWVGIEDSSITYCFNEKSDLISASNELSLLNYDMEYIN